MKQPLTQAELRAFYPALARLVELPEAKQPERPKPKSPARPT